MSIESLRRRVSCDLLTISGATSPNSVENLRLSGIVGAERRGRLWLHESDKILSAAWCGAENSAVGLNVNFSTAIAG